MAIHVFALPKEMFDHGQRYPKPPSNSEHKQTPEKALVHFIC
jgi:hypothetical protein